MTLALVKQEKYPCMITIRKLEIFFRDYLLLFFRSLIKVCVCMWFCVQWLFPL